MLNKIKNKVLSAISKKNISHKTNYKQHIDYSIISCNCIGGILYHSFNSIFLSPTINLYMEGPDFIKFCKNLSYYLDINDLKFIKNASYPIAYVDDVKIHFLHYNSEIDAKNCWLRRKKRVNLDKIVIIFTDRDNFKTDLINEFNKLPYKKVMFSHINYPLDNVVFIKDDARKKQVDDLTQYVNRLGKRRFELYFDFEKWLIDGKGTNECIVKPIDITLYVVTHKHCTNIPYERTLIGVGNKKINDVVIYDSVGDNITSKNKSYCELTALYWIWKHNKRNVVGLEHYRRFFCYKLSIFKPHPVRIKTFNKLLLKYDMICTNKYYFKDNLYNYYKKNHNSKDLDECRNIIVELYPDYTISFDKVINDKFAHMCNMFVTNKNILDSYCSWLFAILFELEKRIDISSYDDYQKRVYGFLAERLFNVWIYKNNISIYEFPIYSQNDTPIINKIKSFIKKIIRK